MLYEVITDVWDRISSDCGTWHRKTIFYACRKKRRYTLTKYPRIMIAAPSSGSGKTQISCGLLQAFQNRGIHTGAFKIGPDYIDPMFHERVIGTTSRNLDLFFLSQDRVKELFCRHAASYDLSVRNNFV